MIFDTLIAFSATVASVLAQCDYSSPDGNYNISWTLHKPDYVVRFNLVAKQKSAGGYWTGVGFGDGMQNADMIIVNTVGNKAVLSDRHSNEYAEPKVVSPQNAQLVEATVENGVIAAEFTRSVNTGDPKRLLLQDPQKNGCQTFLFPEQGGPSVNLDKIMQHAATPTKKLICNLDACADTPLASAAVNPVSQEPQVQPTLSGTILPNRPMGRSRGLAGLDLIPQPTTSASMLESVTQGSGEQLVPNATMAPENVTPGAGNGPTETPTLCPPRADHRMCVKYVDSYLKTVFEQFERSDKNLKKACNLLHNHEKGLVLRECCNYLAQPSVCRSFMQ